jgi:hypothetical protein
LNDQFAAVAAIGLGLIESFVGRVDQLAIIHSWRGAIVMPVNRVPVTTLFC